MAVITTDIKEYPLVSRGKVRDIYQIDSATLLIVTTDRMSAFDVVLEDPIEGKGKILNQITLFWLNKFSSIIPNHIKVSDFSKFPADLQQYQDILEDRAVLVQKATPLPVECIVRGYLSGSGWKDYQKTGMVCGQTLPSNLLESDKLEQPLFTPSTKAAEGMHDENITLAQAEELLGKDLAQKVARTSLELYSQGRAYAATKGIIIADTKFEFGIVDNELILIDEVLTPDSSRFWSAALYKPGQAQPSFDKQYLRDWLEAQVWDKTPPAPRLPKEIAQNTAQKYTEAYRMLVY